tara:strand:- start:4800 stop:5192 length:393 start_codon:yes stop_codon:yes gene_type:complete
MIQTANPKVKLNGIEYLLLSIQTHPGKSQRWHLKRKHMYQHGRPDYHKGGSGCGYFISSSYRNILWRDHAPLDVEFPCWNPTNRSFIAAGPYKGLRSKSAQMHLTVRGWERANKARMKLGLEPIPFVQNS